MTPHVRCLWLVGILLLGPGASPALAQQDVFRFSDWKGQAFFDSRTGAFKYCAAGQLDDSPAELSIFLTRNQVPALGVHHPGWTFNPERTYEAGLTIDGEFTRRAGPVSAPEPHFVVIPLPVDDPELLEAVAAMRRLNVEIAGRAVRFSVRDVRQVIFRLSDCVDVRLAEESAGH